MVFIGSLITQVNECRPHQLSVVQSSSQIQSLSLAPIQYLLISCMTLFSGHLLMNIYANIQGF